MTTTWFDESYPPSLYPDPVVPLTSVTAGTPGTWQPPDATIPTSVAELRADPVVGNTGTNHPGARWAAGQYVELGNVSKSHAYWDGTGWQSGNVPAAPTVTTLAPTTGTAAGGTVVTVTGTNLTGATGATFGGTAGTAFSVTNATTAVVTSPAHAAGAVDVVVSHPSGNATTTGGFTYS